MNIQTDPNRLQKPAHLFPAAAEQPIRAHFLHEDRLRALGESLARNEIVSFHDIDTFDFQARIRENAAKILAVYRSTNTAQARGDMVTPAAQWLLDNNYLVEETIFQIKRDLPRRFYRELPTLSLPNGQLVPRALAQGTVWRFSERRKSVRSSHCSQIWRRSEPVKLAPSRLAPARSAS